MNNYRIVTIEMSNRHIHLNEEDLYAIFGEGYRLAVKNMMDNGEFAARETVTLASPDGELKNVRVMGPPRKNSQAELLLADCFNLKLQVPISMSGDLSKAAPIKVIGPNGTLDLKANAIIAMRHIHIGHDAAASIGYKDGDLVRVKTEGVRGLIFENTVIRTLPDPGKEGTMHIDFEEGNAAGLMSGSTGFILE